MKRLFTLVFVLVLCVLGVGFFRGWFGATTAEAGKKGVTLSWNADKFKEDMGAAGSKIKAMSQGVVDKIKGKAKAVSGTVSELDGRVTSVDVTTHTVTIDSDGNSIPLVVPDSQGIGDLVGKNVRVTLEKSGDTMVVTKIAER